MSTLAGKNTTLWVGASPAKVAGLESFNCGATASTIATAIMGDTWETFVAGLLKGDEISAAGFFDPTDTTGQIALRTAFLAGTPIACEVRYGTTVPKVAFSALVLGFATNSGTNTAVTVTIKIQPNGAMVSTDV